MAQNTADDDRTEYVTEIETYDGKLVDPQIGDAEEYDLAGITGISRSTVGDLKVVGVETPLDLYHGLKTRDRKVLRYVSNAHQQTIISELEEIVFISEEDEAEDDDRTEFQTIADADTAEAVNDARTDEPVGHYDGHRFDKLLVDCTTAAEVQLAISALAFGKTADEYTADDTAELERDAIDELVDDDDPNRTNSQLKHVQEIIDDAYYMGFKAQDDMDSGTTEDEQEDREIRCDGGVEEVTIKGVTVPAELGSFHLNEHLSRDFSDADYHRADDDFDGVDFVYRDEAEDEEIWYTVNADWTYTITVNERALDEDENPYWKQTYKKDYKTNGWAWKRMLKLTGAHEEIHGTDDDDNDDDDGTDGDYKLIYKGTDQHCGDKEDLEKIADGFDDEDVDVVPVADDNSDADDPDHSAAAEATCDSNERTLEDLTGIGPAKAETLRDMGYMTPADLRDYLLTSGAHGVQVCGGYTSDNVVRVNSTHEDALLDELDLFQDQYHFHNPLRELGAEQGDRSDRELYESIGYMSDDWREANNLLEEYSPSYALHVANEQLRTIIAARDEFQHQVNFEDLRSAARTVIDEVLREMEIDSNPDDYDDNDDMEGRSSDSQEENPHHTDGKTIMTDGGEVPDEVKELADVTGASVETVMDEYEAVKEMVCSTDGGRSELETADSVNPEEYRAAAVEQDRFGNVLRGLVYDPDTVTTERVFAYASRRNDCYVRDPSDDPAKTDHRRPNWNIHAAGELVLEDITVDGVDPNDLEGWLEFDAADAHEYVVKSLTTHDGWALEDVTGDTLTFWDEHEALHIEVEYTLESNGGENQ